MTQTDFEPDLSFVTLSDDSYTLLLNDDQRYSIRVPMDLSRKNADDIQKTIEVEILNACNSFGLDSVTKVNVSNVAKKAVALLNERWAEARGAEIPSNESRPQMETLRRPPLTDYNARADYWHYKVGVNVFPADTQNKITYIRWSKWQIQPIPQEQFDEWKATNAFAKGMAIIVGKVWRGPNKDKYLIFMDFDNQKAIDEFCTRNGVSTVLQNIAEKFIVEQHNDAPDKCHVYFYSEIPFVKKSSDSSNSKFNLDEVPAFEIKGQGSDGIAFCSPSLHKNGHPYEIIGTGEPITLSASQANEMMQHLDSICKKYGLRYLQNDDGKGKSLLPTPELFKDDFVIHEKQNRHEALLRIMESLLKRNYGILSLDEIIELAHKWNQKHCKPPLDEREFERQWKDAQNFIKRKDREREEQEEEQAAATETRRTTTAALAPASSSHQSHLSLEMIISNT